MSVDHVLIDVQHLYKNYQTGDVVTKVLRDVSLQITRGEFVSIMGPSGSGKSTLMHILSFLDTATEGSYLFNGEDVSNIQGDELAHMRNKSVGFVFQAFNLLPRTTVFDNVKLPLIYSKNPVNNELIKKSIESVGLANRMTYLSNQLSGGEKQRVAIARAIVNDPDIVFADEPTGNLDSKSGNQILRILQNLNDEGRTIVMVTHEQETAYYSKRMLHLRDGHFELDEVVKNRLIAKDIEFKK